MPEIYLHCPFCHALVTVPATCCEHAYERDGESGELFARCLREDPTTCPIWIAAEKRLVS